MLNPEQIALAQQLYDAGERTVQQIADIFNVRALRSTDTLSVQQGQAARGAAGGQRRLKRAAAARHGQNGGW